MFISAKYLKLPFFTEPFNCDLVNRNTLYLQKVGYIRKFNFFWKSFLWQGSGKLEKAEILELTVEYLKALQGRLTEKQEQNVKIDGEQQSI